MDEKIYKAFKAVSADETLKENTKAFLSAKRTDVKKSSKVISGNINTRNARTKSKTGKHRFYRLQPILAACVILLVAAGIGAGYLAKTPVSYISIDVNPSMELSLNRWDRVVDASDYNDDGEKILNTVSVKGMVYTEAVDTIVTSEAMQPYLTQDSSLNFTVASGDSKKEESLKEGLSTCRSKQARRGKCYTSSVDEIDDAHSCGTSFGKYAAYKILSEYDETITLDECKSMTMAQIRSLIAKYEMGEGSGSGEKFDDNNVGHNGGYNGEHNGGSNAGYNGDSNDGHNGGSNAGHNGGSNAEYNGGGGMQMNNGCESSVGGGKQHKTGKKVLELHVQEFF